MTYTKKIRLALGISVGLAFFTPGAVVPARAQQASEVTPIETKRVSQEGRDPFRKYQPPRVAVKRIAGQISPPPIQERIAQYKAQKQAAMSARMPAPKPTIALLLSEVQVIGISRSPRGYAAIVEATPIHLSYVLHPGERFFDGQLVAIEDNRLVFRHETVFSDGRRERSVQIKPLRQPSAVDGMSSSQSASSSPGADSEKRLVEKAAVVDKP
jgi:hypothetical protein